MKNKNIKIIVDICMLIFIILSFIRWDGDPTFHIIAGTLCALFFAVHICIHRKWIGATPKSFKKVKSKIKLRYITDMLLLIIWSIAICSGFIALIFYSGELRMSETGIFGRIHAVTTRAGIALVVIHIVQHLKQIGSYFRIFKIKQNNKSI
jgi:hypothetical protein